MSEHKIVLPCGTLQLTIARAVWPLEALLDFASRANPRRPFLFVSKVLGRHLPCRPAIMRSAHEALATQLAGAPEPIWTIGLAETAIGLGGGVGTVLARQAEVYFQHTTRLPLATPPLLTFTEVHSHAPTHFLHRPAPALTAAFSATRTLVLIDDELSTGRSIEQLALAVLPHLPRLEWVAVVALVNWLAPNARAALARTLRQRICRRTLRVQWASLLDGQFSFAPAPAASLPTLPPDVDARTAPHPVREDLGRRGLRLPVTLPEHDWPPLPPERPLALLGTGECAFMPVLLADRLAQAGHDVTLQCTSRSPVMPGGAIRASVSCPDPYGQGVGYYLHNPPPPEYTVLAVYETAAGRDTPHPGLHWLRWALPNL